MRRSTRRTPSTNHTGPGSSAGGTRGRDQSVDSTIGSDAGNVVSSATPVAVLFSPMGAIFAADRISSGNIHSCATRGTKVWCWGANADGQQNQNDE